jgi:hypothetical protein
MLHLYPEEHVQSKLLLIQAPLLRKPDLIHHRGVRLALGIFAVMCKTENVLYKAELPTLTEMRDENTMKTGIRILTNENHTLPDHKNKKPEHL